MARSDDLRADFDRLGVLLAAEDDGSKAAALARERRAIGEVLEKIEQPEEATVFDELALRRRTGTEDPGAPSRRRRSRGG